MLIAHDVIGDGPAAAVFLHGILGSKSNWKSFARRFVEARPRFRAVVADLRNHGDSHGFAAPHTIEACAADVAALLRDLKPSTALVVGHSYGGKVALQLAATEKIPVWSLDAPPGLRTFAGGDVERVLACVGAVPLPIPSRRALVEDLRARGLSEALAQWMTTNLKPAAEAESGFTWRFDLEAIPEMLASFAALDLWPVVERAESEIHLVRAAKSDRWGIAELAKLTQAPHAHIVNDAGHWLHTDNPSGLLAVMLAEIPA